MPVFLAAVIGYLLGALPFGYLVARAHGVDIFKVGSGSPGATNVKRVLGAKAGNMVFALDAVKGAAAAGWPLAWQTWGTQPYAGRIELLGVVGLIAALLGHSFSCFTRFKGGKGVATGAGGLLVLLPIATLAATVAWIVTFYSSRYVSLASIVAVLVLPVVAWAMGRPHLLLGLAVLVTVFVVVRHLSNIRRLLNGTENRFVPKSGENAQP